MSTECKQALLVCPVPVPVVPLLPPVFPVPVPVPVPLLPHPKGWRSQANFPKSVRPLNLYYMIRSKVLLLVAVRHCNI